MGNMKKESNEVVKPTFIQYGTWTVDSGKSPEDTVGYWLLFDSLEDAVDSEEVDVYRLEAKLLGRFKKAAKVIRAKRRKKRK